MTSVPPTMSGAKISWMAASNAIDALWSTRSAASKP